MEFWAVRGQKPISRVEESDGGRNQFGMQCPKRWARTRDKKFMRDICSIAHKARILSRIKADEKLNPCTKRELVSLQRSTGGGAIADGEHRDDHLDAMCFDLSSWKRATHATLLLLLDERYRLSRNRGKLADAAPERL